jgi:hypothetical protein
MHCSPTLNAFIKDVARMETKQIPFWVLIRFNSYNQLDGCDEFVHELKKICPVQRQEEWYPSACSGLEFVFNLFINSPITTFITGVVLPGLAWDVTKAAFIKAHDLFKHFLENNEGVDIQELVITFDDIALCFNGAGSYGTLLNFYHMLPMHLQELKKQRIEDISKIEFPFIEYIEDDTGEKYFRPPVLGYPEETYFWKITYYKGCEVCFYQPSSKKIL